MMNENEMIHETNGEKTTDNVEKITCDTAGDLLPLYVDEVLSPDSVALVEAHLAGCESCTGKLNSLKAQTNVKDYDSAKPMKKFKDRLRRHKILTGVTVGLCAAILLGLFLCFFQYTYRYDQLGNDIEVISDSDGHVHIVYSGDKLLFSHYELVFNGMKDGKAQYTLSFYESFNFVDWFDYEFSGQQKQYHQEGRPFEIFSVCPNDTRFGAWCDACLSDRRFVKNGSVKKGGELLIYTVYDFDKPTPYTEAQRNQMLEATEENEALGWYDPYEPLEVEICRVEYRCFDSIFAVGEDQYGATIWEKMYHFNSMEETTYP